VNILVTERVLAAPEAFDALDDILQWVALGRHEWVSRSFAVLDSPWLSDAGRVTEKNKRVLQKILRATTASRASKSMTIVVDLTTTAPNVLSPDRAQDCMDAPLHLVVENAVSDREFLTAVARAYGADGLLHAIDRGYCVFVHAGGKGDLAKRALGLRDQRMPRTGNRLGDVARIFCVADSDRLAPAHEPQSVTDLLEDMSRTCIQAHILYKRDAENYLPVDVLPATGKRGRARLAFLRLKATQRDFYDMKLGFAVEKGSTVVPREQKELFRRVARPADIDELRGGFGKKVGERFGQEEYRKLLTEDAFEAVCVTRPGELRGLLDAIEALL